LPFHTSVFPSEWWQESFAMLGAIAVDERRLGASMQTDPALRPSVAFGPIQPPNAATTTGG